MPHSPKPSGRCATREETTPTAGLEHSLLGFNCGLSDINCALGISQLNKIESILSRRATIARLYFEALQALPQVTLPTLTVPDGRISWFAFVIRVANRQKALAALAAAGIGATAYFPPIHLHPLYQAYAPPANRLAVTEDVASRTLALPFFNALTKEQVQQVCQMLGVALQNIQQIPGEPRTPHSAARVIDAEPFPDR